MSSEEFESGTCPACEEDGKGNGNGIAFVCKNQDCRVTAFTFEAVRA